MEAIAPEVSKTNTTSEVLDPIAAFPTTGQPISDTMLKEMMLSLQASLHADLVSSVKVCQVEVQNVGDRINQVEHTLGGYFSSFNTLVDSHNTHNEEILWLKDTIADLEDRSRRNNIQVRGILKSVPTTQLQ